MMPIDEEQGPEAAPTAQPEPRGRAKTARERTEQKRAEKLEQVREQVESGSLVIRQMTDEERRRYQRPPRQAK